MRFSSIRIASFVKKFYLTGYRSFGLLMITGTLAAIVIFGFLMTFFFFNTSWVAPTVLSPTSDKMLQFVAGYQQAIQNVETLRVAESQAERDSVLADNTAQKLFVLNQKVRTYTENLAHLSTQKKKDLAKSYQLIKDLQQVKTETLASAQAGLITKTDVTQILTSIQQFSNVTTDGDIAVGTVTVTAEAQDIQLQQQMLQAQNDAKSKHEMVIAARVSLKTAESELKTLEDTSYRQAMNRGANLAFVPYDNLNNVRIGLPVYDCSLMVIICHKVGTIKHIYSDEQLVDFPIFNMRFSRTIRGVFVSLNMTVPASMADTIVFVGSKPLFL